MNPVENLAEQMANKTDDDLLAMFKRPDDWRPEALEIASAELQRRGIAVPPRSAGPPPLNPGEPVFFPVSPAKLVVMSTFTFGIYELYWFYRNWKAIKRRTGASITPFWRAFFGILFCYQCFKEVEQSAKSRGISCPSPGWLAIAWVALTLCWRLPYPYGLVCWLTPLPLLPIQNAANQLNSAAAPNHDQNSRFSAWNIAAIVVGGLLFAAAIFSAFLPQ